jgi:hypothetical protein
MEVSTPIKHWNLPLVKELMVTTEQDAAAGWVGPTASLGISEKSLLLLPGFECWIVQFTVQSLKSLSFLSHMWTSTHTHALQTYTRRSQNTVTRSVSVITRPDQARYLLQTTAFYICHVGPDCNAYRYTHFRILTLTALLCHTVWNSSDPIVVRVRRELNTTVPLCCYVTDIITATAIGVCAHVHVCLQTLFRCTFLVTSWCIRKYSKILLYFSVIHSPVVTVHWTKTLSGWWLLISTPYP